MHGIHWPRFAKRIGDYSYTAVRNELGRTALLRTGRYAIFKTNNEQLGYVNRYLYWLNATHASFGLIPPISYRICVLQFGI